MFLCRPGRKSVFADIGQCISDGRTVWTDSGDLQSDSDLPIGWGENGQCRRFRSISEFRKIPYPIDQPVVSAPVYPDLYAFIIKMIRSRSEYS